MDQPQHGRPEDGAEITLTPDMRPAQAAPDRAHTPPRQPRPSRWPLLLGGVGALAGVAALAAAGWTYTESQGELRRLASELAQVRVGLELYARNGATAAQAPSDAALTALADRVAVLEENAAATVLPDITPPSAAPVETAATNGGDCLPSGMRILVAAGDSYPICGETVAVDVEEVANGYIVLAGGLTIASGGSLPLVGSPCTLGVTSGGDEGITGYAEIRVTC